MKKYLFPKSAAGGSFHLFFPSLCSTVHIWTLSRAPDTKWALNIEYVLVPLPGFLSHILFFQYHFLYHITVYFSLNNLSKWCGNLWFIVEEVGQATASDVPLLPVATCSLGRSCSCCALTVHLTSQAVLYICISICWINTYIPLQTNICRTIDQL